MSSPTPARKVLLIGATGSIGSIILQALITSPIPISVTILKHAGSTAPPPPNIPVITLSSYNAPISTLVPILGGYDAIISCQTTFSVSSQLNLIDAAIQAGVKRFFPSEYGLNNMRDDTQALCSVFKEKGTIQKYLREREDQIEWTSIACGTWLKWSFEHGFLGIDVKGKKTRYWDDGEGRFSINTEGLTAKAMVKAVTSHWEETRNRIVFLSEVVTSQREIVEEVERQMGGKKFEVEKVDMEEEVKRLQERFESGEKMAVVGLIEAGLVSGKFGTDFEREEEVMTEKLGLNKLTLEEMVADALAGL
ncbi:NAD(P)-binding protein [Podospora fimiseda]|uniref:NAD(P)-binding protein n=1 Tax=Podospora fimiseda TaxID=252190 RepID=A0AAN6YMV9_9PEZI|nr:NAD(P)-binding protein [Podospora fimiseda]